MLKPLNFQLRDKNTASSQSFIGQSAEHQQEWQEAFDFLELVRSWKDVVGDMLAQHSAPLRIRQGTLFVLTRHAIFAQELSFHGELLKRKLRGQFPRLATVVQKLAFETNETFFQEITEKRSPPPAKELPHPFSPAYRRARAQAEEMFTDVTDPQEKERWISLFMQTQDF